MEKRVVSPEDVHQEAANREQGQFGDFMFMSPRIHVEESSSHSEIGLQGAFDDHHDESKDHDKEQPSSHHEDLECSDWYRTGKGKYEAKSCWKDGSMWVYKLKRKKHKR